MGIGANSRRRLGQRYLSKIRGGFDSLSIGHLQVYKQDFYAKGSREPEKYLITTSDALKQRIAGLEGVENVMARLNFAGLLNNGRTDLPIIGEGIEPEQEARLGSSVLITRGRQSTDKDTFGIMVGQGLVLDSNYNLVIV